MSEQKKPQVPTETGTQEPNVSGEHKPEVTTAEEYAAAIKELKEKSVSREDYDKLRADHSALIKKVAEGQTDNVVDADTSKEKTLDEIKEDILKNKSMSNLDYVKNALSYRKQMIEKGKGDPFAPNYRDRPVSESELASAEKVATILQECVDNSNGNNELFNSELQRRMRK